MTGGVAIYLANQLLHSMRRNLGVCRLFVFANTWAIWSHTENLSTLANLLSDMKIRAQSSTTLAITKVRDQE